MTKRPFIKFYGSDWRADTGLRLCSYAARGLWIDLLTIMHEADQFGYLLIFGKSPSAKDLSILLGGSEREIRKLLDELEYRNVFSRSDAGVVYSRRMIRDAEKAEKDRENGRTGGNPRLTGRDNPTHPGGHKRGVNPIDNRQDKAHRDHHIPETRKEEPPNPPSAAPNLDLLSCIELCRHTGRPLVNGWLLDETFDAIVDTAQINLTSWRGDQRPLIAWLRDLYEPEKIIAAIRKVADRKDYSPPFSLAWFDRVVRAEHPTDNPFVYPTDPLPKAAAS